MNFGAHELLEELRQRRVARGDAAVLLRRVVGDQVAGDVDRHLQPLDLLLDEPLVPLLLRRGPLEPEGALLLLRQVLALHLDDLRDRRAHLLVEGFPLLQFQLKALRVRVGRFRVRGLGVRRFRIDLGRILRRVFRRVFLILSADRGGDADDEREHGAETKTGHDAHLHADRKSRGSVSCFLPSNPG